MTEENQKKESNRFAYLDRHATKELPGTMPYLERDANEAAKLHMSYGQYKAKEWLEAKKNRYGF